jgi:hypothetical protein
MPPVLRVDVTKRNETEKILFQSMKKFQYQFRCHVISFNEKYWDDDDDDDDDWIRYIFSGRKLGTFYYDISLSVSLFLGKTP